VKRLHVVGIVLIIALAGGFYFGFSSKFFQKPQVHDPVERVGDATIRVYKDALENIKTTRISIMDFPDKLYLSGKIGITEDRTTVIPSRVTGRIENIYFASGEMVTKNQLLATIFSPDFVAAKEEYYQALKESKKKSGEDDFTDLARLARKKLETLGLTRQDIDGIAKAANSSSGDLDSDKSNSRNSPLLNLRATRDGFIIAKGAILGNLVNVGDTLFTIGDMDKVWFTGDLYPEDLPKVRKGQEVNIAVTGADKPLKGEVSFISPMVDPVSRSIKIRALIDNPHAELKADMYVQGSVTLSTRKALLVPAPAVVRTPEGNVVFMQVTKTSPEDTNLNSIDFKRIPVELGEEREGMVAVVKGLEEGDAVVNDGAWLLDSALNTMDQSKDGAKDQAK
jgi:RND family efflux transporter MFP subunit